MPHEVTLTLASTGREVDVWDGYAITLSMLDVGSAWTFAFWHSDTRTSTWPILLREVKALDQVQVRIDGALVLAGTLEEMETSVSREGAVLTVSGRDLAGPLVDWDADPRVVLVDTTLEDVLTTLFAPLRVPVLVGVDATEAREVQSHVRARGWRRRYTKHPRRQRVDRAHPRQGERIWQLADRVARKLGYMLWVAPTTEGLGVVVDAPRTDGDPAYTLLRELETTTRVSDASNVLDSHDRLSVRNVPTSVAVYGGTGRGDDTASRFAHTEVNAALLHPRVLGSSDTPLHERYLRSARARSPAAAQAEAQRLIAEANRGFRSYTATVRGHSQTVGGTERLYTINEVAHVRDEISDVDESMLVTSVTYKGSRSAGQTTEVHLAPLGLITVIPEADA